MKRLILATLLLFPAVAHAEAKLDEAACSNLSAAYVPGVDAYGRPVVSADLEEHPVKMPETFSFDITVDVAKASGLTVPDGVEGQAKIGTITYDKGVLSFNGKPLEPEAEEKIKAMCSEPETSSK